MRWRGKRQSNNIEDRRGQRLGGFSGGGGSGLIRLLPMVFRLLGFKGTVVVVIGAIGYGLYTGNLAQITGFGGMSAKAPAASSQTIKQSAAEKEMVQFVSTVLADTEDSWRSIFRQQGQQYPQPKLVLFRDAVNSGCGRASARTGPFYCPADQKVYLDLDFFDELKNRHGAPGDFAQAYVIAHEIGHHVQTVTGISKKVRAAKKKLSKTQANQLSVRQELQADCYAGLWANQANRTRQLLEAGDIEEGLTAAGAIGDDRLQKQARGYVTPESFTHGSSAQRVKWFTIGWKQGTLKACDTFGTKKL